MPFGPPILWAETSAKSAPDQEKANGTRPTACTMSSSSQSARRAP